VAAKEITSGDAALFRESSKRAGFLASVHSSYLINLGCGPGDCGRSPSRFIDELQRCDLIEARTWSCIRDPAPTPPRTGRGGRWAQSRVRGAQGKCKVLLETAAGQGPRWDGRSRSSGTSATRSTARSASRSAWTPARLRRGYDISTDRGYDETFRRFDDLLGIERLLAFHLNDSMKPLGCRVDRHEQACKGESDRWRSSGW